MAVRQVTEDPLFTVEDAGYYLNIPLDKLRRMRWRGAGPAYLRQGTYLRHRKSALDAWLASIEAPAREKVAARLHPQDARA